jgi:hypothetical protein
MTEQPDGRHDDTGSPSDAAIDAMLDRTHRLARIALANHPQRDRAIEILEHGGWLFCCPVGDGRH